MGEGRRREGKYDPILRINAYHLFLDYRIHVSNYCQQLMSNCAMTKGISYVIEEDTHSVVHQPTRLSHCFPERKKEFWNRG